MYQVGFIGFGSMGSMLVKGLLQSKQVDQKNIIVTRKNIDRLQEIKELWPEINVSNDICEVARNSRYLFLCTKPFDIKNILEEIRKVLLPEQHIISLAGSILISDLEGIVNCKISKLIPTVISEVNEGISLICHSQAVTDEEAASLEKLLEGFSLVKQIKEEDFDFAADLTSCGPGLIAAVFDEMVEAGMRRSNNFTYEDINEMVQNTLYGTAKLLLENQMDFKQIISRVATKGGITEEGVQVIKSGIPTVYDKMFDQMKGKRIIVNEKIHNQYKTISY
jgi:pyrroline-5-carboxylate reductase